MALLELNISKKDFHLNGESLKVLENLSFAVEQNEFLTIIGPSGCGKSTILKIILGLDTDYEGSVILKGKPLKEPGLDRGIVFQDHRLLPWLNVRENIGFALPKPKENKDRIDKTIEALGLTGFETAWPEQLSGGMAQRVALGRAIINMPEVLLLDEAFGSLDDFTRAKMQVELNSIIRKRKVTTVMVTHNIDEAVLLSDRIVVLKDKPSSIIDEIVVDFKGHRDKKSPEFIKYRNKLISEL